MTPLPDQTPLNTADDLSLVGHGHMMGTIDRLVQHLDYDAILDHTNMTPKNADEAFRWYICDQSIHFYFVEQQNAFEAQAVSEHLVFEHRTVHRVGSPYADPTVWIQEPGEEPRQLNMVLLLMEGSSAAPYRDQQSIEQITRIFLGAIRVIGWLAAERQLYPVMHSMATLHNTVQEETGITHTAAQTRRNLLLHLMNAYKNAHDEAVVANHARGTPWEWRAAMMGTAVRDRIADRAQYENILAMERAALQSYRSRY